MPASRRAFVPIALVLLGAGAALLFLRQPDGDESVVEPVSTRVEPAPVTADTRAAPRQPPAPTVAEPCTAQSIDLTEGGSSRSICVTDVSTDQNGSVRSYRVQSRDAPHRWLRIDALGSRVLSAALGGTGTHDFRCREDECGGIEIGRRDVQGARVISLNQAALRPAFAVGEATDGAVLVSGSLQTVPEEQLAGLACTDQGVSITTSDSSSVSFCPKGGAGFEIGTDGRKTYRFSNLDGESIRVAVDDSERVKQIEYQGDSTLACMASSCGSVRISPPNSAGERTFTFAGTMLTSAESSAVMSGTLVLPQL